MSSLLWILVATTEPDTALVLQLLRDTGYSLQHRRVETEAALRTALDDRVWDFVLVDSQLNFDPEQTWLPFSQSTPVIVLANPDDETTAIAWMRQGARDYCLKGQLQRLPLVIAREQQQAEVLRSLQPAEHLVHLAAIVHSCTEAIISIDSSGRVLTWNQGAELLYGYAEQEAIGQALSRLIHPDRWVSLWSADQWKNRAIDHHQATHRRKDGSLVDVFLTISLVRDRLGNVLSTALILRDMGERRRVEQMKEEFLAIVSHEFRTPLTSLQGAVELLLTGKLGELNAHGLRMLQIVSSNLDRLVTLTQNLLDLQTLEAGTFALLRHPCNLADLMLQAAQSLEASAQQAQVSLQVSPVEAIVQVDRERLVQVLTYLLNNAIKFSSPGGQIWLRGVLKETTLKLACRTKARVFPPTNWKRSFSAFTR
jgi:PAS domain S-box-containing protein